jgi:membrane protease YdiL (CAAX protease family)
MRKDALRRHPLISYFALAFVISWGGIGTILAATGFDLAAPQPLATGLIFIAMLLGPSVSGLILTAVLEGRAGLGRLVSRTLHWRAGVRWYAVALLTVPLILLAILWSMSALVASAFAPHFQWMLLAVGLVAGGVEEIGWTGFATPRLLARSRVGVAGMRLGLIWALWHALVAFLFSIAAMGNAWIVSFAIVYVATLTPYRILMTWVYANTQSVLLAMLMHAGYTGWLLVLFPSTSPAQSLMWQSAFAAALWIAAAMVMLRHAHRAARAPAVRVAKIGGAL